MGLDEDERVERERAVLEAEERFEAAVRAAFSAGVSGPELEAIVIKVVRETW